MQRDPAELAAQLTVNCCTSLIDICFTIAFSIKNCIQLPFS